MNVPWRMETRIPWKGQWHCNPYSQASLFEKKHESVSQPAERSREKPGNLRWETSPATMSTPGSCQCPHSPQKGTDWCCINITSCALWDTECLLNCWKNCPVRESPAHDHHQDGRSLQGLAVGTSSWACPKHRNPQVEQALFSVNKGKCYQDWRTKKSRWENHGLLRSGVSVREHPVSNWLPFGVQPQCVTLAHSAGTLWHCSLQLNSTSQSNLMVGISVKYHRQCPGIEKWENVDGPWEVAIIHLQSRVSGILENPCWQQVHLLPTIYPPLKSSKTQGLARLVLGTFRIQADASSSHTSSCGTGTLAGQGSPSLWGPSQGEEMLQMYSLAHIRECLHQFSRLPRPRKWSRLSVPIKVPATLTNEEMPIQIFFKKTVIGPQSLHLPVNPEYEPPKNSDSVCITQSWYLKSEMEGFVNSRLRPNFFPSPSCHPMWELPSVSGDVLPHP